MTESMFCTNCGENVPVTCQDEQFFHTVKYEDMGKQLVTTCDGPFLENAPECDFIIADWESQEEKVLGWFIDPDSIAADEWDYKSDRWGEIDPDWDVNLEEPSQEELAKMNLNAEEIWQDLGE